MSGNRITDHPILGPEGSQELVSLSVDGRRLRARKGEMIAAALLAGGIRVHRYTTRRREPRGIYCGIGQCTDCVMVVNGVPNVRTCITQVEEGMVIQTQRGLSSKREG